ncbi:glycosyltransferase family 8 protein [Rhizobium sp. BR 314]|uniref:glycosyltransferase family 8 protein n=1 Tax=Rhizobium sp. BR 314 TaxID=3040013 RepID=UPI0039BED65B
MKEPIPDTSLALAHAEPFHALERASQNQVGVAPQSETKTVGARARIEQEVVNIAFGLDLAYLPHAAVVVTSITANAPGARFHFLILHDGIAAEDRTKFEFCGSGHSFLWLEINDPAVLTMSGKRHISRATYFRLMIGELAPSHIQRVIYLDADLVVKGDIRELYAVNLDGRSVGAVSDVGMDYQLFARRFGLPFQHLGYFNSGVLVLDLNNIRRDGDFQRALDLLQDRPEDLEYADQCALNVVFWQRWAQLDVLWNVQRRTLMPHEGKPCFATAGEMKTGRRPKIVHFTEYNKPWSLDGWHPLIWLYYDYLRRTPYNASVREMARVSFAKDVKRQIKTLFNWWRLQP